MTIQELVAKLLIKGDAKGAAKATDDTSKGLKGLDKDAEKTGKSFNGLGKIVNRVGLSLATYFGVNALKNFLDGAVSGAADFERQIDTVSSVLNGTAQDMALLEKAAEGMGATTKFTSTEAAKAMEELARAGASVDQIMTALPSVLDLAAGSKIDLATAADLAAGAVGSMGLGFEKIPGAVDILVQAAASARTTVGEMGRALIDAGPPAADLGLSIGETAALVAKFADAGFKGERGGTALKIILSQLEDPASKARVALRQLGFEGTDVVDMIDLLNDAGPRGSAAIRAFGTEAGPALRALLKQGGDSIRDMIANLEASSGAADKAANTIAGNLAGAVTGFESAWDALKQALAKPLLKPLAEEAKDLARTIREWVADGSIKTLGQSLADAFRGAVDWIKEFVARLNFNDIKQSLSGLQLTVKTALDAVGATFNDFKVSATGAASGVIAAWNLLTAGIKGAASVIVAAVAAVASGIAGWLGLMSKIGLASKEAADSAKIMADGILESAKALSTATKTDLQEAAAAIEEIGANAEASGKKMKDMGADAGEASKQTKEAAKDIGAAYQAQIEAVQALYDQGKITAEQLTDRVNALSDQAAAMGEDFGVAGDAITLAADQSGQAMDVLEGKVGNVTYRLIEDLPTSAAAIEGVGETATATANKVGGIGDQAKTAADTIAADLPGGNAAIKKVGETAGETKADILEIGDGAKQAADRIAADLPDAAARMKVATKSELDALVKQAENDFGTIKDSGEFTYDQIAKAAEDYLKKAAQANNGVIPSTEGATEAVRALLDATKALGPEAEEAARKMLAALGSASFADKVAAAAQALGVKTKTELDKMAEDAEAAFYTIRVSGEFGWGQIAEAAKKYLQAATEANNGVLPSTEQVGIAVSVLRENTAKLGETAKDSADQFIDGLRGVDKKLDETAKRADQAGTDIAAGLTKAKQAAAETEGAIDGIDRAVVRVVTNVERSTKAMEGFKNATVTIGDQVIGAFGPYHRALDTISDQLSGVELLIDRVNNAPDGANLERYRSQLETIYQWIQSTNSELNGERDAMLREIEAAYAKMEQQVSATNEAIGATSRGVTGLQGDLAELDRTKLDTLDEGLRRITEHMNAILDKL